jgi:4-aminobutyrate aminotransferase-like enzyme/Ser/Thr protein kinase RdoA (MazF antagonist)
MRGGHRPFRLPLKVKFELPTFAAAEAELLAQEYYGLRASARSLSRERDPNFPPADDSGKQFVLKLANGDEQESVLDMQNKAMEHLASAAPSLLLPRLCRTTQGERMVQVENGDGSKHFLRLLTYVPGKPLAKVSPHAPELLRSLGTALGAITKGLMDFHHPSADRELKWDARRAGWIREYLKFVAPSERRRRVEHFLGDFEENVAPRLAVLRTSIVYNDANDYNVIVGEGDAWTRRVIGVIDFGDMLRTTTVSDLAVGAAYAMLGKPAPLAAAAHVVAGYHHAYPLEEAELEILFSLICTRLSVSVTNSAYQRAAAPANEYLTTSEAPAWAVLERLAAIHSEFAHFSFRHACGLEPNPRTPPIVRWLKKNSASFGKLVEPDPKSARHVVFDLSANSPEVGLLEGWQDAPTATERLFARLKSAGARIGVGRYNEPRCLYTSRGFQVEGIDGPEWRTIHVGIDLFAEPGSPVFAPLDGVVHSFRDNDHPLDYGPTIILQHAAGDSALRFFTLYGHLSEGSLEGLREDTPVKRGAQIARIGNFPTNGGWPPHLHFQIITALLGHKGDFPGVALARERELWLSISPDPNLIAGIPDLPEKSWTAMKPDQILVLRSQLIGKSLSISYRRPLETVRGSMQYLYDDSGRPFLDCVNNVAHVGHCHPRVVRAGQEQMAVLNTNTRYLHENLVRYAQRLTAKFPEPLRVCFFVCSGSEANELALRLAHAHTNRKDILVLDAAYHGNTSSLIEISPYKFDGAGGSGAPPHVHKVPLPDDYRGAYKRADIQAGAKYARQAFEAIEKAAREGRQIGGFIAESLPSCGGQIVLPPNYLRQVYRYVRAAGGVCIADEVQTGFGRVGIHFWGFETQDVVPDIVTMGKPIGNGHPLAAVVTTPEIAASFANGMEYFNTFGGNPVSCAIGMAVLDVIDDEHLQAHASDVGTHLIKGLHALREGHPLIGDVRGLGLFLGVEFVRDRRTLEPAAEEAAYIVERMKECGILLSTDGPFHNVIKIKPPLAFTRADADLLITALDRVLGEDFVSGS